MIRLTSLVLGLSLSTLSASAQDPSPAWLEGFRLRWPVQIVGDLSKLPEKTVLVRIPSGGWLQPDASDLAVQSASGDVLPVRIVSHAPAGDTLIQFPRVENQRWYWVYGAHDKPPAQKPLDALEGLTLEIREWAGDDLASWASVRAGLQKSDNVVGNAHVLEIKQNGNPARPGKSSRFAASYRGTLNIPKDGLFRFFVNADDASFLFINGFKVYERTGAGLALKKINQEELEKRAGKIELKAGPHPFELHQVVGDNEQAHGFCSLFWLPPQGTEFDLVPAIVYSQAASGQPAFVEDAKQKAPAGFAVGMDDFLTSGSIKLHLVRFVAQGSDLDPKSLHWDFGDGVTGVGLSPYHVYWREGDYTVSLKSSPDLPAFRRSIHVWEAPGETSPFSLTRAVASLAESDWSKVDEARLGQMYEFLVACEQPHRWEVLEKVARQLLLKPEIDSEFQVQLQTTRMETLARLGRAKEALQLADEILPKYAKAPSLRVRIQLASASIHQVHLKDAAAASKLYKALVEENRRVEHPNVRLAVIRWGDLFAEAGDFARAAETYRLAQTLGGEQFLKTAQADAFTRGARLRIAEQRLRSGDIGQTRRLLEQIELDYPEQKLEGLYRFLRAEADRFAGHYEEALRSYEILLKLPQGAGYRNRTLQGIADAYYRMGHLDKSLKWYASLKDSFGGYFEREKLKDVVDLIQLQQKRVEEGKTVDFFQGFEASFEPNEANAFVKQGKYKHLSEIRAAGLDGTNVGLVYRQVKSTQESYFRIPVSNLKVGADYWVEFWYNETLAGLHTKTLQRTQSWFSPADWPHEYAPGKVKTTMLERTFGQWRKIGMRATAPLTPDTDWRLAIISVPQGYLLLDAVSVRLVSDRENDSLLGFLEGNDAP